VSDEYLQFVLEQLAALGHLRAQRMFGAVGLYCDDCFFGLISAGTLYFKVGEGNLADYESRGMGRFRPYPDRPERSMGYYQVPADVLDEAETLVSWARAALAVARSAPGARFTLGSDRTRR
jgi:DNA transformation protein and related proteins